MRQGGQARQGVAGLDGKVPVGEAGLGKYDMYSGEVQDVLEEVNRLACRCGGYDECLHKVVSR